MPSLRVSNNCLHSAMRVPLLREISGLFLHPPSVRLPVLDISMPNGNGLDAARRLKADGMRAKIVFLTVHDDPDFLREGLLAGGMGYVIKDRLVSDLPRAVHDAVAGRKFVSASPNLQL